MDLTSSVHVKEGEACEIRENTRHSLTFAAELLGVEADQLEKAAVSKTMAVRATRRERRKGQGVGGGGIEIRDRKIAIFKERQGAM